MLLTTPESLSLMLSWPDAERMFGSLSTVIIDEVHAFAPTKRGDLLNLALSRLERFRPGFRRVALSATVQDPAAYVHWPAPRSEEHPSELQSLMRISYAVFCLKQKQATTHQTT